MDNEKELIQKLSAIVAKQQKIITKLAQSAITSQNLVPAIQADIIDVLYGKDPAKIPIGKEYPQVHYAKVQPGGVLVVGLTISDHIKPKWEGIKTLLAQSLARKYSTQNQPLTSIEWRE